MCIRDRYSAIRYTQRIDRTCIVVTVLCNQPEAFASDLGDDQSRYLLIVDGQLSVIVVMKSCADSKVVRMAINMNWHCIVQK